MANTSNFTDGYLEMEGNVVDDEVDGEWNGYEYGYKYGQNITTMEIFVLLRVFLS